MKKIILLCLLFSAFTAFAQENTEGTDTSKKHEFRLDAVEIVAIAKLDVDYEYLIDKHSGAGLSIGLDLGDDLDNYTKFEILPYYRQYLFNKNKNRFANGLFVEGFLRYAVLEETFDTFDFATQTNEFNDVESNNFGAGFGIGYKWVSDNGFVLQLEGGVGRNFGDTIIEEAFFRGGINLGYRF